MMMVVVMASSMENATIAKEYYMWSMSRLSLLPVVELLVVHSAVQLTHAIR